MKAKIVIVAAFIGLVLVLQCQGQTKMPIDWVQVPAPAGANELLCANNSRHEWRVEMQSTDELKVSRFHERLTSVALPPKFHWKKDMPQRATVVVKAGDGWLVGFNDGEFGGGLWWTSADGRQTKALSRENVQVMLPRGNEILVLTGLNHMFRDEGEVYSYTPAIGKPGDLVPIANLGAEPGSALMQDSGTLIISTTRKVLSLSPTNRVERLYENENMGAMYPNSIIADQDGTIFVGMRFYVLRLKRRADATYGDSWFVRCQSAKTKLSNSDCICTGKASVR